MSLPATIRKSGRSYRDVVTDLSQTGLYLQGELERLRPGERVLIALSLPAWERTIPLELEGEVVRVVRNMVHRTKGIGVRFLQLKPAARDAIEAYLTAREGRAPGPRGAVARAFASASPDDPTDPEPALREAPATSPRRYDFSAEAPDLDDDEGASEDDTDPRFRFPEDDTP